MPHDQPRLSALDETFQCRLPHGLISDPQIGMTTSTEPNVQMTPSPTGPDNDPRQNVIRPSKIFALPLLLAGLAVPLASPLPAQAQNQTVTATNGAWQIVCLEGTDSCAMQQVGKSPQGEDAMVVRISKVDAQADDGQKIPATVEIVAPLGVILPAGLRVQIDGGQVRGTSFQLCLANGCLAQDVMNQAFIDDMKGGTTAKMIVVVPRQGEVIVNISLSGFTKSFNSLKPLKQNQ